MTYHTVLRNEELRGQHISPTPEQERAIAEYISTYRASFGARPIGVHWVATAGDFVYLPPTEGVIERQ